jgi:predicted secreted protein
MTCYAGKDGALSIGGTNIAMLTAWNVTQSAETLECAYMGVNWKDYKAGLRSWEGSADANFTDDTATQAANEVVVGTEVAVVFYPVDAGTMSFTGTAIVTSIDNNAALGDVQTVSLSLTGSGELVTALTV